MSKHTTNTPQTQDIRRFAAAPNMLAAALAAAADGWHVAPAHTPLHDHPAGHTCTCEAYRHTDACKERDADRIAQGKPALWLAPGEHCKQPGKHPRVNWKAESTREPEKIRAWWRKWPTANILADCGKSDRLVLDADLYKQTYSGGELWADGTRAQHTGGGGLHVIFDRQGKPYGNQTGALPDGIDIRGVGGYIILAPSLHASGRRYTWANDAPYSPIPAELDSILSAAHAKPQSAPRAPVQPVDLDDAELLDRMFSAKNGHQVHALWNGDAGDDHSAADYRLCCSLAFWTGGDAARMDRMFRQSGLMRPKWERSDYRNRTINAAIDATPEFYDPQHRAAPDPTAAPAEGDAGALYDAVRSFHAWTQTPACIDELRDRLGDDGGRAVLGLQRTLQAIALLTVQRVTFTLSGVSSRKLAEMTAQSHVTTAKHLSRLAELGIVALTDGGLLQVAESLHLTSQLLSVNFQQPGAGALAATLGDDFFSTGGGYSAAIRRRTMPSVLLRSAGPAARFVWAVLQDGTHHSAGDIADATHLSAGSIRTALSRLVELRLVDRQTGARGAYLYALADGAGARLEMIRPHTMTYGGTQRRRALHLGERAAHLQRQMKAADPPQAQRLRGRIAQCITEATAIKTWLAGVGIAPAKGFDFDLARWQRQRITDRRQDADGLTELSRQLAGLDYATARHDALLAGWSAADFGKAWVRRPQGQR